MNRFAAIAKIDYVLDSADSAPEQYAQALTALVPLADKIELPKGKGRQGGDQEALNKELAEAYRAVGHNVATARKYALRLKYAILILAANPKREEETEDNYVKRCKRIRAMANAGDVAQIEKAIAGDPAKVTRKPRPPKGKPAKADKPETVETVEVPELSPADRYDSAHNALMVALKEYQDARDAWVAEGGRPTKKSTSIVESKLRSLIADLTA